MIEGAAIAKSLTLSPVGCTSRHLAHFAPPCAWSLCALWAPRVTWPAGRAPAFLLSRTVRLATPGRTAIQAWSHGASYPRARNRGGRLARHRAGDNRATLGVLPREFADLGVVSRPMGLISRSQTINLIHMIGFVRRIPQGDQRERMVCAECGHIAYENPKVVVGSVVVSADAVLMCRRAIEPRLGYWTLPAGYLELGETLEEGARREALEEAHAEIALDGILAVFSIARIDQVQVIFRARFAGQPRIAPGPESLEVALFPWDRIPASAHIAFPSVRWALDAWRQTGAGPLGAPIGNPPDDRRGVRHMDDASGPGGL